MEAVAKTKALKGGEFLVRNTEAQDVFIPEAFNEEQRMMAQACKDFVDQEITPHVERMDSLEEGFMESLLDKAGEIGLLSIGVPEEHGGLGMSFNTTMLVAEYLGGGGSFSTAFGAHTGIGTLPIQYYGTEEQKAKYLPKLATGEWKASYCLTEPDAGSDANAGKTKAVLNEAGTHYLITGQKMWISNAGFADLMIVFAKIDQDKNLTAFIVERSYDGITMGEEEKKMGIKGSSTRQVFFNDTPVPVENMLSERENGFKIAVNILNIGRIKLAAAALGGAKLILDDAVRYANERKQFGQSISSFGAIKYKLAEIAARTYALESACYRAGQNIEDKIDSLIAEGMQKETAILKGVEQYAIECAILKVHGSEVLDFAADEGVQIYGGMGFSAEAPMERAYRDARITRIYEGTNEINRMLLVGMILKRALKGELDLMGPAKAIAEELISMPRKSNGHEGPLAAEHDVIERLKKVILMIAGKAAQELGEKFKEEQELLMNVADMVIEVYMAESALLRTEKLVQQKGEGEVQTEIAMTKVYTHHAIDVIQRSAKEAIAGFVKEDDQKIMLTGLKRYTKATLVNTKALRRSIANYYIDKNGYPFFK